MRKIEKHRLKTGGGSCINIQLTPSEERVIYLWGRLTVKRTKNVTTFEGIPTTNIVEQEDEA